MNRLSRLCGAMMVLLGVAGREVASQPEPDVHSPEFRAYQAELERVARAKLPDELVSLTRDGWLWRKLRLWIKVRPVGQEKRWSVDVFLEDTVGNRVRTVPDRIRLTASDVPGVDRPLENGEAVVEVEAASPLKGRVVVLPYPAIYNGDFLMGRGDPPAIRTFGGFPPRRRVEPPARAQTDGLVASARADVARGRPLFAQRAAYLRAQLWLQAGDPAGAEAAFREGWREFDGPLCRWAEARLLRRRGEKQAAAALEREIRERYPNSVVAQFLGEPEGECWFFEDADLFTGRGGGKP